MKLTTKIELTDEKLAEIYAILAERPSIYSPSNRSNLGPFPNDYEDKRFWGFTDDVVAAVRNMEPEAIEPYRGGLVENVGMPTLWVDHEEMRELSSRPDYRPVALFNVMAEMMTLAQAGIYSKGLYSESADLYYWHIDSDFQTLLPIHEQEKKFYKALRDSTRQSRARNPQLSRVDQFIEAHYRGKEFSDIYHIEECEIELPGENIDPMLAEIEQEHRAKNGFRMDNLNIWVYFTRQYLQNHDEPHYFDYFKNCVKKGVELNSDNVAHISFISERLGYGSYATMDPRKGTWVVSVQKHDHLSHDLSRVVDIMQRYTAK